VGRGICISCSIGITGENVYTEIATDMERRVILTDKVILTVMRKDPATSKKRFEVPVSESSSKGQMM